MSGVLVGFDVGGTKCAVSTGREEKGSISLMTREAFPTPRTQKEAMERMCALALAQAGGEPILGVGLSAGNPMDADKGMLLNPPNLPGWTGLSLTEWASRELNAPAKLENDANACALAEWRWGAGRGTRSMVFITFGTGCGAGLILDGRLYRGCLGNAGELGHWRLREYGPSGYGKPGSFEGFCSGGGIRQLAVTIGASYRQRGLPCTWLDDPGLSARTVADAARGGDPAALEVYDLCGRRLGQGLALLIDLLNPERVVIGSIFARAAELLVPAMERALREETLADSLAACPVVPAALGERLGDYAALALAAEAAQRA